MADGRARKSGFTLEGLGQIPSLSKDDKILINTADGMMELPAEVLGAVFSSTSLFETYNRVQLEQLNVDTITTTRKIKNYFNSDTSSELFFEYIDGDFVIKYGEVLIVEDVPQTIQATDLRGKPLYWNENPDTAEIYDDFPWKTESDEKLFIGYEKTDYPVMVYQYREYEIKRSHIDINSGFPTITDTYSSMDLSTTGYIEKNKDSFVFQLVTNQNKSCGIKVVRNNDGTLGGELIGVWDGLNDIDPDQRLTKNEVKEFLYNEQDYYTYIKGISLETSDKIGWYLLKETKSHVYSRIDNDVIIIYLAETKTNLAGSYVTEQARNIFGHPLYWKQDMTFGASVTDQHIPLKDGIYTYMTTEVTDYPVYIYQYNLTELCKFSYEMLPDRSYGVKQTFGNLSGNKASLYQTTSGLVLEYLDSNTNTTSKVLLNRGGGTLIGKWLLKAVETQDDSINLGDPELPVWSGLKKGSWLYSDGKTLVWKELPNELPTTDSDKIKPYLSYDSTGKIVWKEGKEKDTNIIPSKTSIDIDMTSDVSTYVVQKQQGDLEVNLLNLEDVPESTNKVVKIIFPILTGDMNITWDSHIVPESSEDLVPDSVGYTEYTLTFYSSLDITNKPVFLKKTVYGVTPTPEEP